MKSAIDIENMLIWAYRDMKVERMTGATAAALKPRGAGSNWTRFEMLEAYGTFIQASARTERVGTNLAADDAERVHARVLSLPDAFIEETDAGEAVLWDIAHAAALGLTLSDEGGRAVLTGGDRAPIRLERIVTAVVLIQHARLGIRPECFADLRRRAGRPRRDTELAPGVTYSDAMYHRAVYSIWHAALGTLAADLASLMETWAPTGPATADSPWLEKPDPAKRLLQRANSSPAKSLAEL